MKIRAAVFDIDGTLVPFGRRMPSAAVCAALRALRQRGVLIVAATGRAAFAAREMLASIAPDYYVASNGSCIQDKTGRILFENKLTGEEMYALVDFCEDYDLPLSFSFDDAYYAYIEYAGFAAAYAQLGCPNHLVDGEDQVRHLQGMPYAACACLPADKAAQFSAKYEHLGLRFVPFLAGKYDVLRATGNKAVSLELLWTRLGISWDEVAAFGDGLNDAEMLAAAGFSVAMGNASDMLKAAAHATAPDVQDDGVAAAIAQYLL